jgi:hypothetical protein
MKKINDFIYTLYGSPVSKIWVVPAVESPALYVIPASVSRAAWAVVFIHLS